MSAVDVNLWASGGEGGLLLIVHDGFVDDGSTIYVPVE